MDLTLSVPARVDWNARQLAPPDCPACDPVLLLFSVCRLRKHPLKGGLLSVQSPRATLGGRFFVPQKRQTPFLGPFFRGGSSENLLLVPLPLRKCRYLVKGQ